MTDTTIKFYPPSAPDDLPSCAVCGIGSFAHLHKPGALPKDFERIDDLNNSEKSNSSKFGNSENSQEKGEKKCDQSEACHCHCGQFPCGGDCGGYASCSCCFTPQTESEGVEDCEHEKGFCRLEGWKTNLRKIIWENRERPRNVIPFVDSLLQAQAKQIRREERERAFGMAQDLLYKFINKDLPADVSIVVEKEWKEAQTKILNSKNDV